MNRYRPAAKRAAMIPPKKFTYIDPPRAEATVFVRQSNLQRMKERLQAIKGTPKLAELRKIGE